MAQFGKVGLAKYGRDNVDRILIVILVSIHRSSKLHIGPLRLARTGTYERRKNPRDKHPRVKRPRISFRAKGQGRQ